MTEEELQELEKAVEEARNHLIELNDSYNEILTKEHEKKAKKNNFSRQNSSLSDIFEDLGIEVETKPKSEKEMRLERENAKYWLRMFLLAFFALMSPWFLLPAAILVFVNAIYSAKKNNKIKKEYEQTEKDDKKEQEVVSKVSEKDALYEKLCEARKIYHDLRREYESKKLNTEIRRKEEDSNAVGSQGNGMNPQLYQLYSEYIDYVKNVISTGEDRFANNKCKVYEITSEKM